MPLECFLAELVFRAAGQAQGRVRHWWVRAGRRHLESDPGQPHSSLDGWEEIDGLYKPCPNRTFHFLLTTAAGGI